MTHEPNMIEYLYAQRLRRAAGLATYKNAFIQSYKYAEFLESTPKLGDYVATNEDGEVMEKPKYFIDKWVRGEDVSKESKEWQAYSEALDRVLWKGWEVESSAEGYTNIMKAEDIGKPRSTWLSFDSSGIWGKCNTYEQLITSGVKLERIQRK